MGQKVNPHGMRVGVINDWDSKWFAEKRLCCTACGRRENPPVLKKHLFVAGISKIGIKRVGTRIKIAIYTAKPGMVISAAAQVLRISKGACRCYRQRSRY